MSPLLSTIISIVFLLAGAAAVYTAMSIQGGRNPSRPKLYMRIHRISGWTFAGLFVLMFVFMIARVENYWEESAPRISMHITLAVALFLLIGFKVMIPRFFKGLDKNLFSLGLTVYVLSFTTVAVTGGYHIIRLVQKEPYLSHAGIAEHMQDEHLGKELFIEKCSTCHVLDKIMQPRSAKSWEKVLNDMITLARPRIKVDEGEQILYYLSRTHVPVHAKAPPGATLVERHCLPCHKASELYVTQYSRSGWTAVVKKMNEYDPEIVPLDKTEDIVDFLLKRQEDHHNGKSE